MNEMACYQWWYARYLLDDEDDARGRMVTSSTLLVPKSERTAVTLSSCNEYHSEYIMQLHAVVATFMLFDSGSMFDVDVLVLWWIFCSPFFLFLHSRKNNSRRIATTTEEWKKNYVLLCTT